MAKKPCDCDSGKMTFQQWAAAGGAVPTSYKGREKAWANQVKKYAAGGEAKMQAGGIARLAKSLTGSKKAVKSAVNVNEPAAAVKKIESPTVIVPGKIANLKEVVRKNMGDYGARRVERAADEIKNLERMYQDQALREVFIGDNAQAMVTMRPADFEKYAVTLKGRTQADIGPKMAELAKQGEIDKYTVPTDEYIQHLMRVQSGFDQVPYLNLFKDEVGIPTKPQIKGHEGRHRSRALAQQGEESSLVRIDPRGDLREGLPRRSQEEYIEALREELERSGRLVLPEIDGSYRRPAIEMPEPYAGGGEVKMADGGAAFGRYTTGKKYQGAVKRAREADVNTLADPRTYAFVSGLLGSAPDELGFSVMHPDYEGIQKVGEKGFMGGTILGVAPMVGPMTKGLPVGASIKPKGGKIPVARTQEEQDVINKFGQKQEQEAARAKKVEKLAQESAGKSPEDQVAKPAKSKGKRVKVDADFYRKMAEEKGEAEVLRSARAGEHLKPTPGGYVGAPRTVTSGQALGGMRRAMDKDFQDSVQAVRLADPDRLGTWYDRAKQGIAESTEPYQLPRTLEQHGVYSAGVSPESELGFALKHLNSRVAGEPAMAYRGAPMRNLDTAVAEDRPANMGFKIGEYANKNDPRIPNAGLFGVNDFRRAQGMGYTDPQGNPWKAGVSETMHPFMDAETALQVDRANKAGTGGRTDWAGPHIQEVPWVYGKAQDIHSRGKRGRFGGDELEGIKSSLREANNTARDYMYKHAASATHEAIPGASLGHVRQALDMTPEAKLAYGREGRWDLPAPEYALSDMPEVGAGNRDVIYSAMGYRQLPSREAQGLYMNKLGGVETNPMTIARPLMDFPTGGGGGRMADESSRMMDVAEQTRALIDAQEAGAYNLPNTLSSVKGKNSMVLDTRGMNPNRLDDPTAGVLPTSEQLAKMGELMGDYGFGVTATNRGAVAFPFDSSMDPKAASSAFRKTGKQMQEIFPSSQEKAITSTGYVPGVGKRSPEGPLSTAPYSGEATSDLLKAYAELPQSVALNVSESEAFRNQVRAKALRDSKMGGTRGDIQETRRFFSEADWPRAVEMIRRGMTPAAALAALGYSASSMAGQER